MLRTWKRVRDVYNGGVRCLLIQTFLCDILSHINLQVVFDKHSVDVIALFSFIKFTCAEIEIACFLTYRNKSRPQTKYVLNVFLYETNKNRNLL